MLRVDGKFIYVCDDTKKQELEASGFKLVQQTEKFWVFLNDRKDFVFTQDSKVAINNILTF